MNIKSLATLALLLSPLSNASAQDVSYARQIQFAACDKAPSIELPKPSAKLGAPSGMRIELAVSLDGGSAVENIGMADGLAVMFTTYGADLTGLGGQLNLASGGQFAAQRKLAEFDGRRDFQGDSATLFNLRHNGQSSSQSFNGKQVEALLGDDNSASLSLAVSGGGSANLIGLPYAEQLTNLKIVVRARVTYLYPSKKLSLAADSSEPEGSDEFLIHRQTARNPRKALLA